jgi:hypothetical protein
MSHGPFKSVVEMASEIGCSAFLVATVAGLKADGLNDELIVRMFENAIVIGNTYQAEIAGQVRKILEFLQLERN